MDSMNDTGLVPGAATGTDRSHRLRGLAVTGLLAVVAAVVVTTVAAALAVAAGVDLEVPAGGATIPLSGVALVTGLFSAVGVALALALLRWSDRPARRFVQTTVTLTVVSLVPPLVSGAAPATTAVLVGLHLLPAAVMVTTLARGLRGRSG